MYKKPNSEGCCEVTTSKNDLYRKFRDFFILATEKEFHHLNLYSVDGYVSVDPIIEERILDTLQHDINELLPITGATGIGKTYLLMYCLKKHYNTENIQTNNPMLLPMGNHYDLVYYSDFNITEPELLENPRELIHAKIKAMCDIIMIHFNLREPNIESYISANKLEVKYYSEGKNSFQKDLFRLTELLNNPLTKIGNIIFIFDDLESLNEQKQFSFMEEYLTLYENLKDKSSAKYNTKFLFCLRSNTFYNIYKQDFYNKHRASKSAILSIAPALSEVFKKRFEIIFALDKASAPKREASWKSAREVLIKICDRVDRNYSNLLLKINNNNISNALDDFLSIVSNRRWTQKNVNRLATFKVEEADYYINDKNILRVLTMGEKNIYYQTPTTPIRCILPNPGVNSYDDFLCFLILRAFVYKAINTINSCETLDSLISIDKIIEVLNSCLYSFNEDDYSHKCTEVKNIVENAILYYEENRFIKRNISPEADKTQRSYFILPRGEQIYHLFFSQSILFDIFRDAYCWDDSIFSSRCSYELSVEELFGEALKYVKQCIFLEIRFFAKVTQNKMWKTYTSVFGNWSFSESFLNGIRKSINQVYASYSIPEKISTELFEAENMLAKIQTYFTSSQEERILF